MSKEQCQNCAYTEVCWKVLKAMFVLTPKQCPQGRVKSPKRKPKEKVVSVTDGMENDTEQIQQVQP
jgi:hypothetical protein